jgi:hypothetical protein
LKVRAAPSAPRKALPELASQARMNDILQLVRLGAGVEQ